MIKYLKDNTMLNMDGKVRYNLLLIRLGRIVVYMLGLWVIRRVYTMYNIRSILLLIYLLLIWICFNQLPTIMKYQLIHLIYYLSIEHILSHIQLHSTLHHHVSAMVLNYPYLLIVHHLHQYQHHSLLMLCTSILHKI